MNKHTRNYREEDRDLVINDFLTNTENGAPAISKRTGLKQSFINGTLDRYFKSKKK